MDRKVTSRNLTLADLHKDLRKKLNELIEQKAQQIKNVQNSN